MSEDAAVPPTTTPPTGMPPTGTPPTGTLPCGRDTEALVEQVAQDRAADLDAHQLHCPHCRAALAEFDRLWSPVRAVAAQSPRAPEGVVDAAMRGIRGVAADRDFARIPGGDGSTRIAARVVVVLARHLAGQVPGVRVALSKLVAAGTGPLALVPDGAAPLPAPLPPDGGPAVTAGVAGTSTAVEITLAADYGVDLVALGEDIRVTVADGIRRWTGLDPVAVSVTVDDVLE